MRSVQVHDRPVERAEAGPAGGARPPRRRADASFAAATRCSRPARSAELPARRRARGAGADPGRGAPARSPRHVGRAARVVRAGPARAAPAGGARRRGARRPRRPAGRRRRSAAAPCSTPRRPGTPIASASSAPRAVRRCVHAPCRSSDERVALVSDALARRSCAPSSSARLDAADPLDPGVARAARAVGDGGAGAAAVRAARVEALPARGRPEPRRARAEAAAVEAELAAAAPGAARVGDPELARYLEQTGRLVRLGDGYAVSAAAYERARALVVAECAAAGRIALARFRDLAGCGRRDAQLLLERFDADGVTRRVGDERVLRRRCSLGRHRRRIDLLLRSEPEWSRAALAAASASRADRAHRAREHHPRPALAEAGEERDDDEERQRQRALLDRDQRRLDAGSRRRSPRRSRSAAGRRRRASPRSRASSWSIAKLPRPLMRISDADHRADAARGRGGVELAHGVDSRSSAPKSARTPAVASAREHEHDDAEAEHPLDVAHPRALLAGAEVVVLDPAQLGALAGGEARSSRPGRRRRRDSARGSRAGATRRAAATASRPRAGRSRGRWRP